MPPAQSTEPRRRGPRWLVIGGLVLAFAVALGIGALLGAGLVGTAQAASLTQGNFIGFSSQVSTPSTPAQCATLTVTGVSGQTITAQTPDGTTATIHTTASTRYTKAGQATTASAVTVGSQIRVIGTHNSDGSVTASRIDIG